MAGAITIQTIAENEAEITLTATALVTAEAKLSPPIGAAVAGQNTEVDRGVYGRKNTSPLGPVTENPTSFALLKSPDKTHKLVPEAVIGQAWQAPVVTHGNSLGLRCASAKEPIQSIDEPFKVKYLSANTPGGLVSLLNHSPKLQDRKILDYATTSLNLARQRMWSLSDSKTKPFLLPPTNKPNNLVVQSTNPYIVDNPEATLRKSHSQSQFQWPASSRSRLANHYPHLPPAMPPLLKMKKERAIIKSRAPLGSLSPPSMSTIARGFVLEKRDGSPKLPKNPSPKSFETTR